MDGAVVCVAGGTTTEGNVGDRVRPPWSRPPTSSRSRASTCSRKRSSPAGATAGRATTASSTPCAPPIPDGPDALTIFPDIFCKEPLTPAVADGDSRWAQAVDWAIFATIQAEEFGITSDNVDDGLTSDDPNVVTFLGGAKRRRHGARPRPRAGGRTSPTTSSPRSGTTARSSRPTWRRSASSAASTHCGPTAACSTPRPTGDPGPDRADPKPMTLDRGGGRMTTTTPTPTHAHAGAAFRPTTAVA